MISEPGLDTGGILRFEFDGLGGVGREHQAVHQFACGAQDIGADPPHPSDQMKCLFGKNLFLRFSWIRGQCAAALAEWRQLLSA